MSDDPVNHVHVSDEWFQVVIDECVICGETHRHSRDPKVLTGGRSYRSAHCHEPDTGGYFIELAPNANVPEQLLKWAYNQIEYNPIYFGSDPTEAVCDRHGNMRERTPVFQKDGHIHAARDGLVLYQCPDCSTEMFAAAGEPDADPAHAMEQLVARFIKSEWDTLESAFVDLGSGEMDEGLTGKQEVFFHDPPATEAIPNYLLEDKDWFIHERTGGDSE